MNLVQSWHCSQEPDLNEPVLVLRTVEGRELRFMMPAAAAAELGRALVEQGRQATPAGTRH